MSLARRAAMSAWFGFALAGIFFFPLAAAIDGNRFYLQWEPRHALEAALAWSALALMLGAGVFATWQRPGRRALAGFLALAFLPVLSLSAGAVRQLPIDDALRDAWDHSGIGYGATAVAFAALGVAFARQPVWLGRCARGFLIAISPIALIVAKTLALSGVHPGTVRSVHTERHAAAQPAHCASTFAILFDELSFGYLYDDAQIRSEYPALREFGSAATHYLDAVSPGTETLVAIPSYLASRRFHGIEVRGMQLEYALGEARGPFSATEPDGLFATARRLGLSTEIAGYYLPYCELLGASADVCESFSIYNASAATESFSPSGPILTTIILWPRQFPFHILKGPAFGLLQRALVERSEAFALRPIDPRAPVLRFVHFSIPHEPFVFDAAGYDPPLNPLRAIPDDAYVAQIRYVDRVFAKILASLRATGALEATNVAVFSDHGFRRGERSREVRHVPFIVKKAGQSARADVRERVRAEELLRDIVRESCSAVP